MQAVCLRVTSREPDDYGSICFFSLNKIDSENNCLDSGT